MSSADTVTGMTSLEADTSGTYIGATRAGIALNWPGVVTFSHEAHVNPAAPACTQCHPTLFKMLQTSARKPVRHREMEARRQCGACHDGQAAFALDSCERCHK